MPEVRDCRRCGLQASEEKLEFGNNLSAVCRHPLACAERMAGQKALLLHTIKWWAERIGNLEADNADLRARVEAIAIAFRQHAESRRQDSLTTTIGTREWDRHREAVSIWRAAAHEVKDILRGEGGE